jgi:hypothetical protein
MPVSHSLTLWFRITLLAMICLLPLSNWAATGRVIKVLPHFVDKQGRHTLAPSLFERDAYQVVLRDNPDMRSGMRFDVQWKSKGKASIPLTLKLELRGVARGNFPDEMTLTQPVVRPKWFSRWTVFKIDQATYDQLGQVTAWRATLWEGDTMIGKQQSFLW